jgi:hypothetical protein
MPRKIITHKGAEFRIIALPTGEALTALSAEASAILAAQASSNRSLTDRQTAYLVAILTAWYAPAGAVAVPLPRIEIGKASTMQAIRAIMARLMSDELREAMFGVATIDPNGGKTDSRCKSGIGWVCRP